MSPRSHKRAYQDLLTLLTEFTSHLIDQESNESQASSGRKFQDLSKWFEDNIANLSKEDFDLAIAPRWQAVQTEIKREFKLLSTDILFLASARQNDTQTKRLKSITNRLTKLIGYCQIILKDSNRYSLKNCSVLLRKLKEISTFPKTHDNILQIILCRVRRYF